MCGVWRAAVAAALCVLVIADLELEKRADLSPAPFMMGSRYGRSPNSAPRLMSPRNDRFFMGSRYGKRSPIAPPLQDPTPPRSIVCEFTGIAPLYRCERRGFQPYNLRKADDDPSSDGDQD